MKAKERAAVYPGTMVLREARDAYMAANGFKVEEYEAPTFTIGFWGVPVKFPNTKGRKRIVPFHDLHHVLTGFATDWAGEAEIGAWELRAGCTNFMAYYLNGGGVLIGLLLCPGRLWRAFRAAKGQHTLYRDGISYESVLQMTVGEARARLGIPREGLASNGQRPEVPA
jgi:hypothetical protein